MKTIYILGIILLLSFSFVNADLTTNGIAYWKLDNSLTDSIASYDLTNDGTTYTVSGKINGAYDFELSEGDSIYYSTGINNVASMNVWIKLESNSTALTMMNERPIGGAKNGWYFNIDGHTAGDLHVLNDESGGSKHCYSNSLSWNTNQWYMVSFVINGSNSQFYRNGQPVSMDTCAITSTTNLWNPTESVQFALGADRGASANYFDGIIDEAGLWSRKLTPTEITELYQNGNGCQYDYTACGIQTYFGFNITVSNSSDALTTFEARVFNGNIDYSYSTTNGTIKTNASTTWETDYYNISINASNHGDWGITDYYWDSTIKNNLKAVMSVNTGGSLPSACTGDFIVSAGCTATIISGNTWVVSS